nr:hypothetical protein [Tanacetum cinerariifolium]
MVHHYSIRFKMDNKKHIVNLMSFKEMLHICPRLPGHTFNEPPFEEEILAFLRSLRHSGEIRRLTDVNINKLHQPWRSLAPIINKCLSGKSSGYDSLRLSQAQFLWGFYHKRNVDFAYLLWEDFVYQVEHKDKKKSNEMYYPRFTKFGAMLPIDLTNIDIRNSDAYKEYYAVATGATPPKTKARVWKTKSSFDTTVTPPLTAAIGIRLFTSAKGKQPATTSKAKSLTAFLESDEEGDDDDDEEEGDDVDDDEEGNDDDDQEEGDDEDDQEEGSDDEQASDEEDEEFIHPSLNTHDEEETRDEESFDPIPKTPENTNDEGNGKENLRTNVGREEGQDGEDEEDELYRDVNINLGRGVQMADVHKTQEFKDSHVTLTPTTSQMDVQTPTSVAPLPVSAPTLTPSTIATVTTIQQALTPPIIAPSTLLQDLPNFGSLFGFDQRLKTLEANLFEFMQTNQFAGAVFSILRIVQRYMDQRMNEAVKQSSSVSSQFVTNMFNLTPDAGIESIFKTTSQMDVQLPTSVAPLPLSAPTLTPSTVATTTTIEQAQTPPTTALSTLLQNLLNFGSLFRFNHRLKTLEENFFKFVQTNQFAGAVSSIPGIVQRYMDQRMNKAVKVAVQIQSDRLRDEAQAENEEFLKTIDENMQKIIKEQVKEQVKVQVSKTLPKIEQIVNEQLEAEVLTQSSNSSKISYAVAVDLS